MNEQKKMHNDYFHPTVSKQQQDIGELLNSIKIFMATSHTKPEDYVVLMSLIKRLNQHKNGFPRKVLRSMESKFEFIKSKYRQNEN